MVRWRRFFKCFVGHQTGSSDMLYFGCKSVVGRFSKSIYSLNYKFHFAFSETNIKLQNQTIQVNLQEESVKMKSGKLKNQKLMKILKKIPENLINKEFSLDSFYDDIGKGEFHLMNGIIFVNRFLKSIVIIRSKIMKKCHKTHRRSPFKMTHQINHKDMIYILICLIRKK